MRSVERTFALGERLRQWREIGKEFRVLVDHALEHRVVVEILAGERLVLLEQPGPDHLVAGAHQPLDCAARHPHGPLEPLYYAGLFGQVGPLAEPVAEFPGWLRLIPLEDV